MTKVIGKSAAIPKAISALIQIAIDRGLIDLVGSVLHKLPAGVVTIIGTLLYAAVHGWSYFSNTSPVDDAWSLGTQEIIGVAVMIATEVAARLASAEKTEDGKVISASKAEKLRKTATPVDSTTITTTPQKTNQSATMPYGQMTDISRK